MSNYWEEEEEDPQVEETLPRRVTRKTRRASEGKNNWYLLTGLILGIGLGLLFAWVVSPVKYVDTDPSSLTANYKDEYRRIIALAYRSNGNLERARERMKLVDQEGAIQALAAQAQRMLAENQPAQEARALAVLAADLGRIPAQPGEQAPSPAVVAGATTQATKEGAEQPVETATQPVAAIQTATAPAPTVEPTATRTPQPTFTPRPTATPMRILDAPFTLKSQREVCDGSVHAGLLQIEVTGADGEPLPGVRLQVTWVGGEDTFYTGLVPQISPGYADFQMTTGILYSLRVGDASEPLNNLKSSGSCGLKLEFSQKNGE